MSFRLFPILIAPVKWSITYIGAGVNYTRRRHPLIGPRGPMSGIVSKPRLLGCHCIHDGRHVDPGRLLQVPGHRALLGRPDQGILVLLGEPRRHMNF